MTKHPKKAVDQHDEQLRRIALLAAGHEYLTGEKAGTPEYPGLRSEETDNTRTIHIETQEDTSERTELRICSAEQVLEVLATEARHTDARHPEWTRPDPKSRNWLLRPSEMRIVLATPAGSMSQIVYPTQRAADGSERPIRIEYQVLPGQIQPGSQANEPAWTAHLTQGALLLREAAWDARRIWNDLKDAPEETATPDGSVGPTGCTGPDPATSGGYERLTGTYVAAQWLSERWQSKPPAEVLTALQTALENDPRRASGGLGNSRWNHANEAQAIDGIRNEATRTLKIRRVGWTRPTPMAGAAIQADQARLVIGGGEVVCRIAMNGQLTDPQPPGIDNEDWRGRWTTPAANPVEQLNMLAAQWAAALIQLPGPYD